MIRKAVRTNERPIATAGRVVTLGRTRRALEPPRLQGVPVEQPVELRAVASGQPRRARDVSLRDREDAREVIPLEGAARAQVAARLSMIYLMNRKPDRAIAALRSTRIADLNGELRQQRLLLEARAQSDIGRHDLALDIISNKIGRAHV